MKKNDMMKLLGFFFLIFSLIQWNEPFVHAESVDKSVADYYQQEKGEKKESNKKTDDELLPSTTDELSKTQSKTVGITAWDIIKSIFSLLVVLALLFLLLKWLQKRNEKYPSSQIIKNLGGTNLGGNRSIQIVKVGTSIFIVGVGENIQVLKEVNDEKEIQDLLEQHNERMDQMMKPMDFVTKLMNKKNETETMNKKDFSFKKELEEQMNGIIKQRKEWINFKMGERNKDE